MNTRLVLLALSILLAASCNSAKVDNLYGTWVTPSGEGYYKYVFNPDGTGSYESKTGSEKMECRFTIEKKWSDAQGATWYMQKLTWSSSPYNDKNIVIWYALNKVDPGGKTRESDASTLGYPKDLSSPLSQGFHWIHIRQ